MTATAPHLAPATPSVTPAATMRRPVWVRRTAWGVLVAVLTTSVLLVVSSRVSAQAPGAAGVDWWAAASLPPLTVEDEGGASLRRDDVGEIVCRGASLCVASTTRPELTATIDPDPETGEYRYLVFDLTGAGGLSSAAAEGTTSEPTWVPQAGLLEHGHVYAWIVIGDPGQVQEYAQFIVDLQRHADQALDTAGPFTVGLASGHLFVDVPVVSSGSLTLGYANPGASTPTMVPDGWVLSGDAMAGIGYHHLEVFGDGATVIAHGLDGSQLRYERNADGEYRPPGHGDVELTFAHPTLVRREVGWQIVDPYGATATYEANGDVVAVESASIDGAADVALSVVSSGGQLLSVTDERTGETMRFTYLGDRDCRPPAGFDRAAASPSVCGITDFDGTTTNLAYHDGRLARVEASGAVVDLVYDEAGRIVAMRDPLAADVAAATGRAGDLGLAWTVGYDEAGRVVSVSSPEVPTYDPVSSATSDERIVRSYEYGTSETVVTVADREVGRVVFDAADLALLTTSSGGVAPTVFHYDDEGLPYGSTDGAGIRGTFVTDADGNVEVLYGPAPAAWFDGAVPREEYADQIATTRYVHGAGSGAFAYFYDAVDPGVPPVARALITETTIDVPASVDPSSGWRALLIADPSFDGAETRFRVTADGADPETSTVLFGGIATDLGEPFTVEADEPGRVGVIADLRVPSGASAVDVVIERSVDAEQWSVVEPSDLSGVDLQASESTVDTYRLGDGPVETIERYDYADPSLGTVSELFRDGRSLATFGNEEPAPELDSWARMTSQTSAAGVVTSFEYWGSDELAQVPGFDGRPAGPMLPQYGLQRSVQVGSGPVYTSVHDASGRPLATLEDDVVVEALSYDDRGRVVEAVVPAGADVERSPRRSVEHVYGVDGDPLRTDVVYTVGGDTMVLSVTNDLLDRPVVVDDVWAVTTGHDYDRYGDPVRERVTAADGATVVTSRTFDAAGLVSEDVVSIDGRSYGARISSRDAAARPVAIDYSNGTRLELGYARSSGGVSSHRWTDGDGNSWTETVDGSTQTGRILRHELAGPETIATYGYGYDSTSGALVDATLAVSGDVVFDAAWSYGSGPAGDDCTGANPFAHLDGARTTTTETIGQRTTTSVVCYDADLAPIRNVRTTVTTESGADVVDVPIVLDGHHIVGYDGVELVYDNSGLVVALSDDETTIDLVRTATGGVIERRDRVGGGAVTTVRFASGGLQLDDQLRTTADAIQLPGGVTVTVLLAGGDAQWAIDTIAGDGWFTLDADGSPIGAISLHTPDGQPIAEWIELTDGTAIANAWKRGVGAKSYELASTVVEFGQRMYLPALASFTSADPLALGGSTPFNYANGDPINLADPTGQTPVHLALVVVGLIGLGMAAVGSQFEHTMVGQMMISLGLTVAMVAFTSAGLGYVAATIGLMLIGYLTYQSIQAFNAGDIVGGIFFAIDAVLTLVLVYGAFKMSWKGTYAWKLTASDGSSAYYFPKKSGSSVIPPEMRKTPAMVERAATEQGFRILEGRAGQLTINGANHAGRPFISWLRGTQWAAEVALGWATAGKRFARAYFLKRFVITPSHNIPYHHSEKYRNWAPGPSVHSSLVAPTTSGVRAERDSRGQTPTVPTGTRGV